MGASNSNEAAEAAARERNRQLQTEWAQTQMNVQVQKIAEDTTKPLILGMPKPYDDGNQGEPQMPRREHTFFRVSKWRIGGPIIVKAIGCLTIPPVIFTWCMSWQSFQLHYIWPKLIWYVSSLPIVIVLLSLWLFMSSYRNGRDYRFALGGFILCAAAFGLGTLFGDINYLVNLHDYYFLNALKMYSNVKPGTVKGEQLMDAGRVRFSEDMVIRRDLGMSFTMWDTYCVAPLAMQHSVGSSPEQSSYDIWITGKNCCSAGIPDFTCGRYLDPKAKAGVRQTNVPERYFFNLAVQQAEAAYDIIAEHPIFFTLTTDADKLVNEYFVQGFRLWVTLIFFHLSINSFSVILMVNRFKYPESQWWR